MQKILIVDDDGDRGKTGAGRRRSSFDRVRLMHDLKVYQFHAWLKGISPMIWRRLLLRSDQTVADLHYALQLAFGSSDTHLNSFRIQGKDFGVHQLGGPMFWEDPNRVRLADFHFRQGEGFRYEYDFRDRWLHQIRVERIVPVDSDRTYPVCISGKRSAPPEDCGGVGSFQQRRDEAPWRGQELLDQIAECAREREITALRDLAEEIPAIQMWLTLDQFDRRRVNLRLQQYAIGNPEWQWPQGGTE